MFRFKSKEFHFSSDFCRRETRDMKKVRKRTDIVETQGWKTETERDYIEKFLNSNFLENMNIAHEIFYLLKKQ